MLPCIFPILIAHAVSVWKAQAKRDCPFVRYKPLRKMAERLPLLRRRTVALLDCVAVLIPCEQ